MTPFTHALFQPGKVLVSAEPMPIKPQFSALEMLSPAVDTDTPIKKYQNDYQSWLASFNIEVDQEQDKEQILKYLEDQRLGHPGWNSWQPEHTKPYAIKGFEGTVLNLCNDKSGAILCSLVCDGKELCQKVARLKKPL